MLHRDTQSLVPEFRRLVEELIKQLSEKKIPYFISETKREPIVQKAYYAQGRDDLVMVNQLRHAAGLAPISPSENNRKITWTLNSHHMTGKAIDIYPMKDGSILWNGTEEDWKPIVEIAEALGIEWGGRWTEKDMPHFQQRRS